MKLNNLLVERNSLAGLAMLYTIFRDAPPNRSGLHTGDQEKHFPEACVMLAFAMHLLDGGATQVELRPDGMHGRNFNFHRWFLAQGFSLTPRGGRTRYAGVYSRHAQTVKLLCKSGDGDVIATVGRQRVIAECKGGIINTRHSGARSNLRKGVLEGVGQLLCREQGMDRHAVVLPHADETVRWAKRIALRGRRVGIELAFVTRHGEVEYLRAEVD